MGNTCCNSNNKNPLSEIVSNEQSQGVRQDDGQGDHSRLEYTKTSRWKSRGGSSVGSTSNQHLTKELTKMKTTLSAEVKDETVQNYTAEEMLKNVEEAQETQDIPHLVIDDATVQDIEQYEHNQKLTSQHIKIDVHWEDFIKLKRRDVRLQYDIVAELGKGAFGTVSKVRMRKTHLMRAMKSIKKSSLIKQDQNRIFVQMAILKQLDHPNILKLLEVYDWKNYYYLITQICEGGELFDRIRKLKHFTEKDAALVMKSILSAVMYMHKLNIVHRDLKPENMLYINKDQESNLKLIDFGTARRMQPGKKLTKQIGTAYYIAPEVLDRNYDEKCDIWSCGVIMYILLCGYPPFHGPTQKQIIHEVKFGSLRFTGSAWNNISKDAICLIKKMLERNPSRRISASQAFNSTWIHAAGETYVIPLTTLDSIRNFHFQNRLKAVVMTYIASQLICNTDRTELQKAFRQLDKDGDGMIEQDELIRVFQEHYRSHLSVDYNKILKIVDTNNSGKIDFTEFIVAALSQQKLLNITKLENAFGYFDIDHSGYITIEEIKQFLTDSQDTTESIKKLFELVDANNDGKISKEQFIELLTKN